MVKSQIINNIKNIFNKKPKQFEVELSNTYFVSDHECVDMKFNVLKIDDFSKLMLIKNHWLDYYELVDFEGNVLVRSKYICLGNDGYNFFYNPFDGIYMLHKYQQAVNCHIISLFDYDEVISISNAIDPDYSLGFDFII